MEPLFFETECFRIKVERFVDGDGNVTIERIFIGVKEHSAPTDETSLNSLVDRAIRDGERVHIISAERHV